MSLSSMEASILAPVRKRLPWMVVNLATAFLAASVVGLFRHTIEQVVTLAIFMPVVAGMAGNAGTQSLTVIARGIAFGETEFSSGARAVGKQFLVGIAVAPSPAAWARSSRTIGTARRSSASSSSPRCWRAWPSRDSQAPRCR
jgi:Mg/Co/Ni transporter MgtE